MNSTHPAHRRKLPAVFRSALVAVLTMASVALAPAYASATRQAQPPVAPAAARSTTVDLASKVDCILARTDMRLDSGRWTTEPPQVISLRGSGEWGSESYQFLRGTEGAVTYLTVGCADPNNSFKVVKAHWKNPFFGKNEYDANGTDPAFKMSWLASGGTAAHVSFTLDYTPAS